MTDQEKKWIDRLDRERRARRQAETIAEQGMRELWLANQLLESRVAERTVEVQRSLTTLEQVCHSRQGLLNELGHELATPLHAISGNLELIDCSVLTPEDQLRFCEAREAAIRLDGLLQAILAVAKVDHPLREPALDAADPRFVIDDLLERWQRPAARRSQLLMASVESSSPNVLLDWKTFTFIADSLIESCVRFSSSGPLELDLSVTPESVTLTLQDSGPALPDKLLQQEPSALGWACAGRRGVGLAVAHRMAQEIDGRFSVTAARAGTRMEVQAPRPTVGVG